MLVGVPGVLVVVVLGERRRSYTCRAPDSVARSKEEGVGVERRVGGSVVPLTRAQLVYCIPPCTSIGCLVELK